MADGFPKRSRKERIFLWRLIAIMVGLNFWTDYYHPGGFLIDTILLIVVFVKWDQWKHYL